MAVRSSEAQWEGTLKDGKGRFWTESGEVSGVYSFSTRFEERSGSNPEELIAAALASCYSMALAADVERAGSTPESVRTVARVHLDKGDSGFEITGIDLEADARVSEIDPRTFEKIAQATRGTCPVGKLLAEVPITVRARLAS
jgi:osmotically inducible protein OsmC